MWRELITELTRDAQPIGDLQPGPDFAPGATQEQIEEVERALGVRLPGSLRSLLGESNGVQACFGTPLIFSTDELIRTNREMREESTYRETWMPFDHLLFFGAAGVDGEMFAFPIIAGRIDRDQVYVWIPNRDDREWRAGSLRAYVEWSLKGPLRA